MERGWRWGVGANQPSGVLSKIWSAAKRDCTTNTCCNRHRVHLLVQADYLNGVEDPESSGPVETMKTQRPVPLPHQPFFLLNLLSRDLRHRLVLCPVGNEVGGGPSRGIYAGGEDSDQHLRTSHVKLSRALASDLHAIPFFPRMSGGEGFKLH